MKALVKFRIIIFFLVAALIVSLAYMIVFKVDLEIAEKTLTAYQSQNNYSVWYDIGYQCGYENGRQGVQDSQAMQNTLIYADGSCKQY